MQNGRPHSAAFCLFFRRSIYIYNIFIYYIYIYIFIYDHQAFLAQAPSADNIMQRGYFAVNSRTKLGGWPHPEGRISC